MANNFLSCALLVARKAGDIMLRDFRFGMKRSWKKDTSTLTQTDLMINAMVIQTLTKKFPKDNILSEEGGSIFHLSPYTWVCDPLDGTHVFSLGLPLSVFSIALVKDGMPMMGVIYDPFMKRMYRAELRSGSFLNNKKISVSKTKVLKHSTICAPISFRAMYNLTDAHLELKKRGSNYVDTGATAGMGALVAAGAFDAHVYSHEFAHDVAAVKIIVEEAGGKVTDIFGKEQRYDRKVNGAIISNCRLHHQLVSIMKKYL